MLSAVKNAMKKNILEQIKQEKEETRKIKLYENWVDKNHVEVIEK